MYINPPSPRKIVFHIFYCKKRSADAHFMQYLVVFIWGGYSSVDFGIQREEFQSCDNSKAPKCTKKLFLFFRGRFRPFGTLL